MREVITRRPFIHRDWQQRVETKQQKVIKNIEEHIIKMERMFIKTNDAYYQEAIKHSNKELELIKQGNKKALDKYNLGL